LDVPPSQFIIGAKKEGDDDGGDLDDDAQVCSCHVRGSFLFYIFYIPFIAYCVVPPLSSCSEYWS
jgi:hypothetical protein